MREALSKEQQKRFNDAAAIAEAAGRASMRYVRLKTTEQLELQALLRVRRRFIVERTAVMNQMRARVLRDSRSDRRALVMKLCRRFVLNSSSAKSDRVFGRHTVHDAAFMAVPM